MMCECPERQWDEEDEEDEELETEHVAVLGED